LDNCKALLHGSQAPSIFKSTHAAVLVNVPYNKKATTLEKLLGRMVDRSICNPAAELKSRVQREAQYIQNILKSFDGIRDIELISCFGQVPELSVTAIIETMLIVS
jgi:hypothetical protein